MKMFDLGPRDETDYYPFLAWQVSKKLALTAVAVISAVCMVFLWNAMPERTADGSPFRTYRYDAWGLRSATGKVRILGKSGYTAYEGDVENGVVKGRGTLYGPQGNVVYRGEFDADSFNGTGEAYHLNGQLAYEGMFRDDLYDGEGRLYRENGTLWYEGHFSQGYMEGEGTLYDAAQEAVYKGTFHRDGILYQELLGKSAQEAAEMYTGERVVYMGSGVYDVHMKAIDAVYLGDDRSGALEEGFCLTGLYVLRQELCLGDGTADQIPQLSALFGAPLYQGNTYLEAADMVALNIGCETVDGGLLYGKASYKETAVYEDVREVSGFPDDLQAYIYVYERDGILYTFFCRDKDAGFDFYRMELAG